MTSFRKNGFSLVEVSVAVGVLAVGVVAVIALLVPSSNRNGAVAEAATAARLVEGVNQELERFGFEVIRDAIVGTDGTADNTIWLVATRDGSRLLRSGKITGLVDQNGLPAENHLITGAPPGIAERDRFFLVSVSRLTTTASDPLYYTTAKGFLAMRVMVTWPYTLPVGEGDPTATGWNDAAVSGVESDPLRRSQLFLTASIRR